MESIPDLSELRKRGSLIQDRKRKGSFPWRTVQPSLTAKRRLPGKTDLPVPARQTGIGLRHSGVPEVGSRSHILSLNCSIPSPETL